MKNRSELLIDMYQISGMSVSLVGEATILIQYLSGQSLEELEVVPSCACMNSNMGLLEAGLLKKS